MSSLYMQWRRMGIRDVLSVLLNLSTRWDKWSFTHIGRFTSWGRSPRNPLNRRLGGPQSQSERYGEEENLLHRESSWNVMADGDAREGKWRGNWRKEWEASTLHTTSEHGVSSITTADAHTSAVGSRLNWRPPADLSGLVRFAERRNVVSAIVPSHFKRSLPTDEIQHPPPRRRYPDSKTFQDRQYLFYFPRKTVFDFLKFAFEYRLFFISRISAKASVQEYHLIKKTWCSGTVIIVLGMSRFLLHLRRDYKIQRLA